MTDTENHSKRWSCCPTPLADYGDFSEFLDLFSHPLTSATDQRELLELLSCTQTQRAEIDGISDLFTCPSPLEGILNDAPLSPPLTDDCDHCGCSDVVDEPVRDRDDGEDGKDKEGHRKDHEDDVVFISAQPIQRSDSSSRIKHENIPDPTKRLPLANCKLAKDIVQVDAPPTRADVLIPNQESLAQNTESITREPTFVLGLLVGTILQRTAQGSRSESSFLGLATQYSSQNHQMIPDGTLKANKPSKVKTKVSTSPRKRKLEAKFAQEERPRSKKMKLSSRQPEDASYKPMNVILADNDTPENQPGTWKYEWNSQRKLWIADEAPQEMREWTGEELLSCADGLIARVRPNSDWLPVDMHWREGGEGEEDVFEGSDILGENNWTYQIAPTDMLHMLRKGATVLGTVSK